MGLRQFLRDLALVPTMWRAAVKGTRDRAVLDRVVQDILLNDREALEAFLRLPPRMREIDTVRIGATLALRLNCHEASAMASEPGQGTS